MFESLSQRLEAILNKLSGRGRLSEQDVDEALRQVRLALLEADVNFRVARDFIARVRDEALQTKVLEALSPGQQIARIVYQQLTALLGEANAPLRFAPRPPTVVLLAGLQGSGKTTTAAKLALHLRRTGHHPLLVAGDGRRPAAVEQLVTLGKQLDIPVYSQPGEENAAVIAAGGLKAARDGGTNIVILDTGGRLHIDDALMDELAAVKTAVAPTEVLLVVDAMTGQDAVTAAEEFHRRVGLTGLILAKLDGDARGGAALSIRAVTGVPVKFIGTGERPDALESFHPDRMASRILGMGDVQSLVERVEAVIDHERAQEMERKFRRASFDLEDFLEQLQQVKKMGSLENILNMVPGFDRLMRSMRGGPAAMGIDDQQLKRTEAVILSMTRDERRNPDIIDGSRRRRIARGSGTMPQAVNQVLNQYREMRRLAKAMGSGKMPRSPF